MSGQLLSIGIMVCILYKPYFLSTYTNRTTKPTPYPLKETFCIFTFSKKLIMYDV